MKKKIEDGGAKICEKALKSRSRTSAWLGLAAKIQANPT
jgi:hypothetical protein